MNKSKLIFIILISLIITFFTIIILMYRSDMKRMSNGEPVKYSNWGYAYSTINLYNQVDSPNLNNNDVENLAIDINYNKKEKNIIFVIVVIIFILSICSIIKKFRKK